jgi:DNA-binding MarR family transcriptional regulator
MKELDEMLLNRIRLGVMSLLISVKEADFNWLKDELQCTAGNLSVQIQKLKEAGYIEVAKSFKNNYPLTTCKITRKGIQAFEKHFENLKSYLPKSKK